MMTEGGEGLAEGGDGALHLGLPSAFGSSNRQQPITCTSTQNDPVSNAGPGRRQRVDFKLPVQFRENAEVSPPTTQSLIST